MFASALRGAWMLTKPFLCLLAGLTAVTTLMGTTVNGMALLVVPVLGALVAVVVGGALFTLGAVVGLPVAAFLHAYAPFASSRRNFERAGVLAGLLAGLVAGGLHVFLMDFHAAALLGGIVLGGCAGRADASAVRTPLDRPWTVLPRRRRRRRLRIDRSGPPFFDPRARRAG